MEFENSVVRTVANGSVDKIHSRDTSQMAVTEDHEKRTSPERWK
ncbi:hypothetical protein NYO67_9446 [Aspergillus flavus]|nr:hypothetical protein NYO67_9446 [Aspergillus flavus]